MTKTQLLNSLKLKFSFVEEDETKWSAPKMPSYLGYNLKGIPILEKEGNAMWENNILVWVKDNEYLWKNGEPKSGNTIFSQRLQGFIDTKITDGTVKFAIIKELNEGTKTARCEAIMPDKSTKTLIVKEGAENVFTIEVI